MTQFKIGSKVLSTEHPNSVGEVFRINEDGALSIRWTTPAREGLPFGHKCDEFWPVEDQHLLEVVE